MASYFYRVFIPKLSKSSESFSSYDRSVQLRLQAYFWAAMLFGLFALGVHVYSLVRCSKNLRLGICFTNLYTWAAYMVGFGFAMFVGMILHYGYMDPEEPEFHNIGETIYENEDDDVL